MFKEFKAFAIKGNLIDTAVAFVMGAGFGVVTLTFINGIFMPLVGLIFQIGDLSHAKIILKPAVLDASGKITTPESAILYGAFVGAVINFLIVALVMFMIIRSIKPKPVEKPKDTTPKISTTDALLMEIRDSLKK